MLPQDAFEGDWRLYYHQAIMRHKKLGPCVVYVDEHEGDYRFLAHIISANGVLKEFGTVMDRDLDLMWPRPGAYNLNRPDAAVFVGRQPQRHMKRSACLDHYYLTWWPPRISLGVDWLYQIVTPNPYGNINDDILSRDHPSVALSSRVIIHRLSEGLTEVVYRGEPLGILNANELQTYMPGDSRLPRYKKHLQTVGIT